MKNTFVFSLTSTRKKKKQKTKKKTLVLLFVRVSDLLIKTNKTSHIFPAPLGDFDPSINFQKM